MTVTTYQAVPPLPLTTTLEPDVSPIAFLVQVLAYVAALDFVREVAALEETITFPEDVQQARYDSHCERLLSGTPLASATPEQLRRDALALFGLARDKAANNVWALDVDVWAAAADEAITMYRMRELQTASFRRSAG